jgi:ABC-type bacteriocin/lantibiotic exporter with double-glycine peptidase domain
MTDLPPPRVLLDLPPCLQERAHLCGPAALQSVLLWHGIAATQAALARRMGTTPARGTPLRAIARVAAEHGLDALLEEMDLARLRACLDEGAPAVLLLQAWAEPPRASYADDYEDGHHVVAVGHADGVVLFRDPQVVELSWLTDADLLERWHSNGGPERSLRNGGVPIRGAAPPSRRLRAMG